MKNCFSEQGHIDTPLNDIGEKQAEIAGKALENVEFNRAYSSDLKRAHKTCQLILEQNKMSSVTANEIIQDDRIREQSMGNYENTAVIEWIEMAKQAKIDPLEFCPGSTENNKDVRNRTREFIKSIISQCLRSLLWVQAKVKVCIIYFQKYA